MLLKFDISRGSTKRERRVTEKISIPIEICCDGLESTLFDAVSKHGEIYSDHVDGTLVNIVRHRGFR